MTRTITVGLDGSPASLAAADWAAHEAQLRDLPLRLVTAWETDEIPGLPVPALLKAAEQAELLVLGSRGLSKAAGYVLGSVSHAVLASCERRVVLVRAAEYGEEEASPEISAREVSAVSGHRDVVLGLDLHKPNAAVIDFAFDAASRRAARLRVIHGWTLPPYYYGGALMPDLNDGMVKQVRSELSDVLRPWQDRYPAVEVHAQATIGGAGRHLVDASYDAALVVVGRQNRRATVGAHVGPVTQALLHHAVAPVAVISHD